MFGLGMIVITGMFACTGTDYTSQIKEAQTMLGNGQINLANGTYLAILKEDPTQVDAATGAAYVSMLKGDYVKAEELLAGAMENAGENAGELSLRRALVAVEQKEYSTAQQHALASNLDFGKVLASEIYLIDGEGDKAIDLLKSVSSQPSKKLAKRYLKLLESEDPWVQSYAEAQASWALKDYELAVRSVGSMLSKLEGGIPNYEMEVLMWASRAAVVGQSEISRSLLALNLKALPEDQKWRVTATKAMTYFAEGDIIKGNGLLKSLKDAPPMGINHMKVTTAAIIAESDPQTAKDLLKGMSGTAAAQAYHSLGKNKTAANIVDSGMFQKYLEGDM